MSYLEINTLQGPIVVDIDRVSGAGIAIAEGQCVGLANVVVLFLSGDHVDLTLHSSKQVENFLETVRKIITQRKVRTPTKPILVDKE